MGKLVAQNKWLFIGAALCVLISVVIDYLTPLLLAETLDYYLSGQPSTMPAFVNRWVDSWGGPNFMARNLWIVGLALVGLNIVGGAINFFKGRWQSKAGENVALYLRERLYEHIQHLPFSYHVKAETGDMVQRCTSDVDTVRRFLASQLLAVVSSVLMIVVALTMLFSKNVQLALISMVMVPAIFCFAFLFFKWVVKAFGDADVSEGRLSAVLQENLTGVRVVRAFGQQQYEVEKFTGASADYKKKSFKVSKLLAVYWAGSDTMCMIQSGITLIMCVLFAARGEITVGTMVVFTSYVGKLLWPIRQLGRILADLGKADISLSRLEDILAVLAEAEPGKALTPQIDGSVAFEDVCFDYGDGVPVLSHVSFTVRPGQTIGILGSTGAGKSSLVQLIARLYDATAGEVLVGGHDVREYDLAVLRDAVGVVLQKNVLFTGTVRDNLRWGNAKATDEELLEACRLACVDEFLDRIGGLDGDLGQGGAGVSGGQKQRLCIARALLKRPRILIFDDSTSAVDMATEAKIRANLASIPGVTCIVIAQRITSVMDADKIVVLDDGHLHAQGTHVELLETDAIYQEIYASQVRHADKATPDDFLRGGEAHA